MRTRAGTRSLRPARRARPAASSYSRILPLSSRPAPYMGASQPLTRQRLPIRSPMPRKIASRYLAGRTPRSSSIRRTRLRCSHSSTAIARSSAASVESASERAWPSYARAAASSPACARRRMAASSSSARSPMSPPPLHSSKSPSLAQPDSNTLVPAYAQTKYR